MHIIVSKKKAQMLNVKAGSNPPKQEGLSIWALLPIRLEEENESVLALLNKELDIIAVAFTAEWSKQVEDKIISTIEKTFKTMGFSQHELKEYFLGAGDIEFYLPKKGFVSLLRKLQSQEDYIRNAAKHILATEGSSTFNDRDAKLVRLLNPTQIPSEEWTDEFD